VALSKKERGFSSRLHYKREFLDIVKIGYTRKGFYRRHYSVFSMVPQQKGMVVRDIDMSGEDHTTILRVLRKSRELRTEAIESEWYSNMEVA
jgi:hypothetical protein